MRIFLLLCFFMAVFAAPAAAGDTEQSLKQEVQKIGSAYADSFNRQDADGIAALYEPGGMHVNPAGPRTDIAEFYKSAFKAGFNHEEVTVDQVRPLGTDGALALGEYRITGKNKTGAPIETGGRWTAVYVREGVKLKISMLSAFPKAPPPK
jgi:ketosteroid isomerase-like protein